MTNLNSSTLISLASLLIAQAVWAQSFTGTLTQVKGDVKILKPYRAGEGSGRMRYNDIDYSFSEAKIGSKIKGKQMVLSGPNGQAKLVYDNGDHLLVGPSTAITLPGSPASGSKKEDKPTLDLSYGKLRALVSKGGPHGNIVIKTRSVVAGVRGTDLYVTHSPGSGSQVSVLRGAVEVVAAQNPTAAAVVVKSGETTTASASTADEKPMALEAKPVTKEELLDIQATSQIEVATDDPKLSEAVKAEVAELQKKASHAVVTDIKNTDPVLYAELEKEKDTSADKANTLVVAKLFKSAPKASKTTKSKLKDGLSEEEIYQKFFKPSP